MMSRRSDWVRLTSALKPRQNRLRSNLLFPNRIRFTSTRPRLISTEAQSPLSSSWTTTRVVLLSVLTSSITYLYGSSASQPPAADGLSTGDSVPKYATANDFAKAGCDCELPRSFRSLMHHILGNCGAAPKFIQGCDQHR